MLRPVKAERDDKTVLLVCFHWRSFPPTLAEMREEQGLSIEEIRQKKTVGEGGYQQFLVWDRICRQMQMNPDVCLKCEHCGTMETRNNLPAIVSLDGKRVLPTTDAATLDALPRHRGHRSIHQGNIKKGAPHGYRRSS